MSRRLIVLLAAVALAALAVAPAQGAKKKPRSKTVGVIDYAFTPAKMTVRPGTKIVWKWSKANSAPHDVKLAKGPKGVKKFTSPVYTASISWSRTLKVKGTYRLLCTYHANMRQTIVVK
ncbi:cupredoxin domain-containing protein [Conexibacter arvalis]|uniref:Plastocyanin n=1 Tax=Conexibacter arvalis TaxID=912552 RepID=A0A840II08_9ACTN|nr:plastocyanin/azurin family copper-binding protein [Conexibacter arvalis]MBB4663684.1 plastocyanin [Conexibacter arvalis]